MRSEWLESKGVNYELMIGGESENANRVMLKNNELGSYGVGRDLIDEFNKDWVIEITDKKIR